MGSTCIFARTAISTNSILSLNVLRMLGSRCTITYTELGSQVAPGNRSQIRVVVLTFVGLECRE